mgnify:FL=1
MSRLNRRLAAGEVLILDGGISTELQLRGVPMHGTAWSAAALSTHPDQVREVHVDYIRSGADIITTNSFSTARYILEQAGLGDLTIELTSDSVRLAKEALQISEPSREVLIAGALSSWPPGDDASNLPTHEEIEAAYTEQAELLATSGVDILLLEMVDHFGYTRAALTAAAGTGLPVWLGLGCEFNSDEGLVTLHDTQQAVQGELLSLAEIGFSLVSVMHTQPEDVGPALAAVRDSWQGPMGAYAHSGGWAMPNWLWEDIISPEAYLEYARKWVASGTQVIGGCCGLGPDHIRLLREKLPRQI